MTVGQSPPRVDGVAKVLGTARYVDDLTMPGMWHGATVRSRVAAGRIREIRFNPAFDWSQVTVVTAKDIPGENIITTLEDDQPCLADGIIRHAYEPILLVAAETKEHLAAAVAAIEVIIDAETPILTLDEALNPAQPIFGKDNVFKRYSIKRGSLAEGFAEADVIVEGTYEVGHQEHIYIEPQGMIAWIEQDGTATVQGSLQCPYYIHKAMKRVFNLTEDKVRVIQNVTGGGFGGKEEYPSLIACHAALLALKAGRPVKIIYGREEDIEATTKRHPARMTYRTGVKKDGTLTAMDVTVLMDGGAYCTLTPVVLSRGTLHASGAYRCPAIEIHSTAVATNTPPNGAFRGFGAPQTIWAIERHMDKIARTLDLDPLAVREKNLYTLGDTTATGQLLKESVGSEACVEAAVMASGYWSKRKEYAQPQTGRIRRGIGIATFFHGAGFTGSGEARLKGKVQVDLQPGGRLMVRSGSTDIGQGTETVFAQMAADAAKLPLDMVDVHPVDTHGVPDSGPTVASRTTMVVGSIVADAAAEVAAKVRELTPEGDWAQAADKALAQGPISVLLQYVPPGTNQWDDDTYSGDAYPCFSWGADIAEVEVDLDTMEVTVVDFWAAQDIGKAIHPVMCAGQIEGGTLQAIGWALCEEVVWDKGLIKNNRITNYIIPTALDAPPFHTFLIEEPFSGGPFGAKGVGELPMDGGAPALAAAIEQAIGVCPDSLPLTPERLLEVYRA
ncbi:MAG: xanthine dehydrogenase family protein [Candidatus Sericytochromatia bacterium]|nr:xanthine dehydrogenase family protein [Candidatus Sericytochromatia bacterium]